MEGLGADRSTGLGYFEILQTIKPWTPPALGEGRYLLLSLCHPTAEEIAKGILEGSYVLTERAGWITAPGARSLQRGRVRMLTEGSWYPQSIGPTTGDLLLVQPERPELGLSHPVYRDGRAVAIPLSGGAHHG